MLLTSFCKIKEDSHSLLSKTGMIMKLSVILMLAGTLQVSASVNAQKVTLKAKGLPLEKVFTEIQKQTGFSFFYTNDDLENVGKISVDVKDMPLNEAMALFLKGLPISFEIVDRVVVIKKKIDLPDDGLAPPVEITGRVTNKKGEPIVGASVWIKGTKIATAAGKSGMYKITAPDATAVLVFSSIGYKKQEIVFNNVKAIINVILEEESSKLEDVVISNGIFSQRKESSTGAVATFTGEQLKIVSNQNILKSLAILDPSFQIVENIDLGSDPNKLPDIQLRGQTGFPDLKGIYTSNPNLPLFILDGFETTLEKVNDLNMNLVKSVTLLKDASAKAVWGSKGGNGVVVIETKPPVTGKIRISYNGSMDITAPDLSSYKLTNALQKVEAEVLGGVYTSSFPTLQADLLRTYTINQKAALEGVNTYWLSQPLRNGVGQRHALNLEGGDDAFRYSANISYSNDKGVMKGSDRNTISGFLTLVYRVRNFQFRNSLMVDKNKSNNSPYGNYANTSRMNPYWRIKDEKGNYIISYGNDVVGNPLYDGSLNSKNFTTYTNIIENFYTDWTAAKNLRFTARVGVSTQNNSLDNFIPGNNSAYARVLPADPDYLNRGQYTVENGKTNSLNADLLANYYIQLNKHSFFMNAAYSVSQNKASSNGMTMVGFPNDNMDDISFGRRYKDGSKATGTENTSRSIAITTALNYSFDDRLLADLSLRKNASSQFGADKRWGLFWSTGLGYNFHREKFMQSLKQVDLLKIRASVGRTGTQNFNSYQSLATYNYITEETYNGDLGLNLLALPNPGLQWQQVQDNNIGIDIGLFKKFNIRFDYYIRDTKNLLEDMIIAPSSGFNTYKENIGESRNTGLQLSASMNLYNKPETGTMIGVFFNVAKNTNRIRKVSNSLVQLNQFQDGTKDTSTTGIADTRKPSTRFEPGQSMTAIWAVPSLGIDPANGKEIFIKKDGTLTYEWSALDYIVAGDAAPKYNGSFGANLQHKGFMANFAFTYRLGGQMYNSTLVNRVENADFKYNIDVRALDLRWKKPGDESLYKDIADRTDTKPTTRFVQDLNELLFSSVSFGYDFSKSGWLKSMKFNRIYISLNLNDLARISSVKTERGLDYPFARTISTSLNITF